MPGVNYAIYGCSSSQLQEYHYTGVTLEKNIGALINQDRLKDDNLKTQIKSQNLYTYRLFLLT